WSMPIPVKPPMGKPPPGALSPLELELQPASGRVETAVVHTLKMRATDVGTTVLATTRITAKPLNTPVRFVEVHLPRLRQEALSSLAWGNTGRTPPWGWLALNGTLATDGEWSLGPGSAPFTIEFPDAKAPGKARLVLPQHISKEFTLVL